MAHLGVSATGAPVGGRLGQESTTEILLPALLVHSPLPRHALPLPGNARLRLTDDLLPLLQGCLRLVHSLLPSLEKGLRSSQTLLSGPETGLTLTHIHTELHLVDQFPQAVEGPLQRGGGTGAWLLGLLHCRILVGRRCAGRDHGL